MDNALTVKPNFDYTLVSQEQAVQLQIISARIKVRVERTAEEMLAMGADLQEAKRVCKEDGKLFEDWCNSDECPVGYKTAQRLMSVNADLGHKKDTNVLFNHGFAVISQVTQTRDEDIRQALLEHIEQKAEEGEKVTQQEINALKKSLVEEQNRVKNLQDEVFDAKSLIKGYIAERDEAMEEARLSKVSRDRAIHELMEKDSVIKQKDSEIKQKLEALNDAEEVYRDQLTEMRRKIVLEERNRPKTSEEELAQQKRLKELKDQESYINVSKSKLEREARDLKAECDSLAKQRKVWTKIVTEFYSAAVKFHTEAAMIIGSAQALGDIPMTDELHSQISVVIKDAERVAEVLRDATTL